MNFDFQDLTGTFSVGDVAIALVAVVRARAR